MSGDLAKLSERMDALDRKMEALDAQAQRTFNRAGTSAKKFGLQNSKVMQGLAQEIPMLDQFGAYLTNPYVAAGAAIAGLGIVMYKAEQKAEDFNNQFLELENLNLDKTQQQLDRLNQSILDTAFANGLNSKATAKAYFDIQSATGKYGKEVDLITGRVGAFSMAVKADNDEMINGVGKAMNAYGFGADQLDKFLQSSAKSVQVGITTFDQLAKVQVEYASAAVGAGQSYDEANKFFAAFSKTSKSVDIAATLTKTAFMGLSDPKVQEGLKAWKINVFDQTGKMKGASSIVEDISKKISGFSDETFSKFMGDVGGPEGMRGLLQMIKGQGEDLISTFRQFDELDFDIDKAIANAKKDPKIMRQLVNNQIENLQIRLGQVLLEPVAKGLNFISTKLAEGLKMFDKFNAKGGNLKEAFNGIKPVLKLVWDLFTLQYRIRWEINQIYMKFASESEIVKDLAGLIGDAFSGIGSGIDYIFKGIAWTLDKLILKPLQEVDRLYLKITGKDAEVQRRRSEERMKDSAKMLLGEDNYAKLSDPGVMKALSDQFGFKNAGELGALLNSGKGKEIKSVLDKMGNSGSTGIAGKGTGLEGSGLDGTVKSITEGGKTARHITVNIDKLVENIYNQVTNVKNGMDNAAEIIKAGLIETVRDTEIALGTSL